MQQALELALQYQVKCQMHVAFGLQESTLCNVHGDVQRSAACSLIHFALQIRRSDINIYCLLHQDLYASYNFQYFAQELLAQEIFIRGEPFTQTLTGVNSAARLIFNVRTYKAFERQETPECEIYVHIRLLWLETGEHRPF